MTKIQRTKLKYSYTVQANIFGSKKFKNHKPPGQQGISLKRKKITEYGTQLKETKKFRLFYGITKRYLKNQFKKIKKIHGNKVHNLVGLMERRLSSCVYRSKLAPSIFSAKQLISHGHILVNGKKVDISSYLVKPNDIISLKEGSIRENYHILNAISDTTRKTPDHLERNKFECKFLKTPTMSEELYYCPMGIPSIIEFLSR